jgi:hypothetical protein
MSPQFLVIAYYTESTSYEVLSGNLKRSLQNFNLPHYIEAIDDLGSWEKNTHHKAYFIKEILNSRNQDILYVDVDAQFKSYPDLISSLDCDIAYRTQDFRWRADEALSGTLFLKNNDKVKKFVDRWIELNEAVPAERMKPETWEQKNMQRAQREMSDLIYYNLPPEYTFIYDHMKIMYPKTIPVIEHYQESRNVHKKMNSKQNFRVRR